MQRREEHTEQHDHQAAEPDDDAVDPRLELRFQELQVLLGGDVVVDRVEDLGSDPFGLLAVDISVR